jgi:hypothetical protein
LTSDSGTKRGRRPRICLFEWNTGGHFPVWARAAAQALDQDAEVILAASDPLIEDLAELGLETYSLGAPRPSDGGGDLSAADTPAELARRELRLMREACAAIEPDHCFHLFGDQVLRWWLREEPMPARMTTTLFHPFSQYPASYGVRLTKRERLQGVYLEHKLRRWRRRADAHAIFVHDFFAAGRWAARSGAQVRWLPDPPVPPPREPWTGPRDGCAFYGAIDRRKGFDLLADALALAPTQLRLSVAGRVAPSVRRDFDDGVARIRAAGVDVELAVSATGDAPEPTDIFVRARCAVLPYRNHLGISRNLMEAAAMGTPVVGPSFGANGRLIRDFGLGLAVNPEDPKALRAAILELTQDESSAATYAPGLARYAEERSGTRFRDAVRSVFGLADSSPSGQRTHSRPASGRGPG